MEEVILIEGKPNTIVSGGAIGADTLANTWATENNTNIQIFKPRYSDFPPATRKWVAPKERNTTIVENSDIIIAFWDMKSNGTRDTINKSIERNKKVYVYDIINKKLINYNDK